MCAASLENRVLELVQDCCVNFPPILERCRARLEVIDRALEKTAGPTVFENTVRDAR